MESMSSLLQLPDTATSGITAILLCLLLLWASLFLYKNSRKNKTVPEAPGAWPIIGHLHLLRGSQPIYITLRNMAAKYGPIFSVKLGVHRVLIVSSQQLAKEFYTTHDKAFANRPKTIAMEVMGYNYAMFGFSPYGSYWRQLRKMSTHEILSNARLDSLKLVRQAEVTAAIKKTYKLCVENQTIDKVFVEMRKWFEEISMNLILSMVVGKRSEDALGSNESWSEELRRFLNLMGSVVVADGVPFLRWLDIGGREKAMKKTIKELDRVVSEWLEEHKQKSVLKRTKEEQDFMDVMISVLNDAEQLPGYDADTIIKANCLGMILGGTDTTTISTTWALALLLNNPRVLRKAQQELDTCIGRDRQVQESDLGKLVYLQAIIKESLRLNPGGALSAPHETREDCVVAGYHIPAGTRLIVNLSMLHRDPGVWADPDEFQPERFLTAHQHVDVRGQNFELLPFGAGRRICPGVSFALQVMQLTLASLLQAFDVTARYPGAVDMTEGIGLTNLNAHPLDVLLVPRLPAHLYQ